LNLNNYKKLPCLTDKTPKDISSLFAGETEMHSYFSIDKRKADELSIYKLRLESMGFLQGLNSYSPLTGFHHIHH